MTREPRLDELFIEVWDHDLASHDHVGIATLSELLPDGWEKQVAAVSAVGQSVTLSVSSFGRDGLADRNAMINDQAHGVVDLQLELVVESDGNPQ